MKLNIKRQFAGSESADEIFSSLLRDRGLRQEKEVMDFIDPPKPDLDFLLRNIPVGKRNLEKAKAIIHKTLAEGLDILVFGDYDADGITSSAVMWQTLSFLAKGTKSRVMPFIPDRARHGYGLSRSAIRDILDGTAFADTGVPDFHPSLIVTVDNGIVANDEVAELKSQGIQVIITDHHQPASDLPPADCIIHSIVTSGAGIAWLAAIYLSDSHQGVIDMIDLAAVGIVADQIPLLGVNRSIVVHGLRRLGSTGNLGIKSLINQAGITRKISAYEINYVIAPRINAVGRLDNPIDALRLLCSRDQTAVNRIVAAVENHNSNRQSLTEAAYRASLGADLTHKIIFVASPDFHEGVIGLVATRLAETFSRPAVVVSVGKEVCKGSARSVKGVNITDILRSQQKLLLGVGGHELAGGFSLDHANLDQLKKALYEYADNVISAGSLEKKLDVDGQIELKQVTKTLASSLTRLEPYGMGNPKPRFAVQNLRVLEDRVVGKSGTHRKLTVEKEGVTRDVIWFNGSAAHPLNHIKIMVFTPEINTWRDRESVQLNAVYVEN